MTTVAKLNQIKLMLGFYDAADDPVLEVYLKQAAHEIAAWRFGHDAEDEGTEVPFEYEIVQINAVVAGYSIRGAEGQSRHNENGIDRVFVYEDMVRYIHAHVPQYVRIY